MKRDKLLLKSLSKHRKRRTYKQKGDLPMLEKLLHDKFVAAREAGRKIHRRWFVAQAKLLYRQLYSVDDVDSNRYKSDGSLNFVFSPEWLAGLRHRYGIS